MPTYRLRRESVSIRDYLERGKVLRLNDATTDPLPS
jgi:hypothetical protein